MATVGTVMSQPPRVMRFNVVAHVLTGAGPGAANAAQKAVGGHHRQASPVGNQAVQLVKEFFSP